MGFGSIISKAAGVLSSAGSAGLSLGLPAVGQYASNKMGYRFNKKTALHSPSWEVEGLRKAGLNPILAAAKFGGSAAQFSNASALDLAGSMEKMSSSSAKKATINLTNASADRERSQVSINKGLAEKAIAEANTAKEIESMTRKKADAYRTIPFLGYLDAINSAGAKINADNLMKAADFFKRRKPKWNPNL